MKPLSKAISKQVLTEKHLLEILSKLRHLIEITHLPFWVGITKIKRLLTKRFLVSSESERRRSSCSSWYLNTWRYTSVDLQSKFTIFHWRKYIWKCCQQNLAIFSWHQFVFVEFSSCTWHYCLEKTNPQIMIWWVANLPTSLEHRWFNDYYRKTSNIRRALVGNKIVNHSDVVGASPVGAAPTTSSFST